MQNDFSTLKGGLARESPETVFVIRLVINDQCGLHIDAMKWVIETLTLQFSSVG
jgi:hypothetical protein